jgi:isopropylmalate/homocitrate/citramalate synthase
MNEHRPISRHFKGVIDSTLREGWQFSRAEFTLSQFVTHKYEVLSPQVIGNRRNLVINTVLSGKTRARNVVEFQKRFG